MRKTITANYLKKLDACQAAINRFQAQKERDTIRVLRKCLELGRFNWANWLIVRLMNRKQQLRYAIYAAELVLPNWEKENPDDKRPREAIQAAKKVLKRDSEENRKATDAAADAAYYASYDVVACAARAAADAADAADAAYYASCAAADKFCDAADAADDAADAAFRVVRTADVKSKIIEYGISLLKK